MRLLLEVLLASTLLAQRPPDTVPASGGDITITPIAHGTVHVAHGKTAILVDRAAATATSSPSVASGCTSRVIPNARRR